jgi:hypothetical protein
VRKKKGGDWSLSAPSAPATATAAAALITSIYTTYQAARMRYTAKDLISAALE